MAIAPLEGVGDTATNGGSGILGFLQFARRCDTQDACRNCPLSPKLWFWVRAIQVEGLFKRFTRYFG